MTAPTLPTLLRNEDYRDFFRSPRKAYVSPHPWAVVGFASEGRVAIARFATAKESSVKVVELIRKIKAGNTALYDVSLVCLNRLTPPPPFVNDIMDPLTQDWCGRCRRPAEFPRYGARHPVLSKMVGVIVEGKRRCEFCGVSLEFRFQGSTSYGEV